MVKKTLPVALGVVVGLYAVAQYYIPHHDVGWLTNQMRDWVAILAAAAYVLGAISLVQVSVPRIRRRERDWQYKVVMLGSAACMFFVGMKWDACGTPARSGMVDVDLTRRDEAAAARGMAVVEFDAPGDVLVQVGGGAVQSGPVRVEVAPGPLSFKAFREVPGYTPYDSDGWAREYARGQRDTTATLRAKLAATVAATNPITHAALADELKALETPPALVAGQVVRIQADPTMKWGQEGRVFVWLYDHVFAPCNATMFALLAFFVASAAFRAFRARNIESALLLGSAIIIMVGNMPMGGEIWSDLPDIKDWILAVPNNGSRRAIIMGAAVGAIATSLRVVLGLERSHLGSD